MTVPIIPRASDRICAGCARPTVGFGVVAKWESEILWCCGEPDCFLAVTGTYKMNPREFGRLDTIATVKGGEEAGEYLDEIGKFSLESLSEEEWDTFCRRLIAGYRFALHETLRSESPF